MVPKLKSNKKKKESTHTKVKLVFTLTDSSYGICVRATRKSLCNLRQQLLLTQLYASTALFQEGGEAHKIKVSLDHSNPDPYRSAY